MKTQETNKLIADFMGGKCEEQPHYPLKNEKNFPNVTYKEVCTLPLETLPSMYQFGIFSIHKLQYHTSWDWLMPVVEKIEGLGFEFFIVENRFKINHNTDQSIENVTYAEGGDKLSITYQGIVQFIEYYNNTNK